MDKQKTWLLKRISQSYQKVTIDSMHTDFKIIILKWKGYYLSDETIKEIVQMQRLNILMWYLKLQRRYIWFRVSWALLWSSYRFKITWNNLSTFLMDTGRFKEAPLFWLFVKDEAELPAVSHTGQWVQAARTVRPVLFRKIAPKQDWAVNGSEQASVLILDQPLKEDTTRTGKRILHQQLATETHLAVNHNLLPFDVPGHSCYLTARNHKLLAPW